MCLMTISIGLVYQFHTEKYGYVTAHGTSMYPTIKDGDRCLVQWKVPEGNLTGKIIIFSSHNICHRCILDYGEWLEAKGDNSQNIERLTREEIKGVFIRVVG